MKLTASLSWHLRDGEDFLAGRYGRAHTLCFDGGAAIAASASPHLVGQWANPAAIDPEEMLVAAVSSCHMLWFLHMARLEGLTVTAYSDTAEGAMADIAPGREAIASIVLHPRAEWLGTAPDHLLLNRLHRRAHENCFIANSLRTAISIA